MNPMLMTARNGLFATAVVLLATGATQASTITVNLGQSSQDFAWYGRGPVVNPPGRAPGIYGTYTVGLGSGTYDSGTNISTFILSGSITGSTSSLFSSGTYAFITQYKGPDSPQGGPNAPRQITSVPDPGPGANFSNTIHRDPSTTTQLDLSTSNGIFIIPLVTGGKVDANVSFSYHHDTVGTCTGLGSTPCSQAAVGLVNGAAEYVPVTLTVTFPTPTPLPSAWAMMLGSLATFGFLVYRRGKMASIATHA
jgi:hypothetical protein